MKRYSLERKEAILKKMMPPQNIPISALARENGIAKQTLYAWRQQLQSQGVAAPGNGKNPDAWSSKDKFGAVLEAAALNTAELAQYCRHKGLYVEQIMAWRAACQEANASPSAHHREHRKQAISDSKEIKTLKKELQRKEKALAEAAALIILRKKAQAIWGEPEED